ncbi:NAD(P)-binding protein [Apiospora phragmitis]|uniref:NAD(P)-binding protein n=1 Tax=Apiospora phragmitis TaxID=2905665 RepID=A0ABR1T4P2_9PEZI
MPNDDTAPPSTNAPNLIPEAIPLEASLRGKVYAITGGSSGMRPSARTCPSAGETPSGWRAWKQSWRRHVVPAGHRGRGAGGGVGPGDGRKKLDGAVNAASLKAPEAVPLTEMRASTWQTVLDANLTGVFYSMRAELRRMEAGATLVNVGSILGTVGMECYAPYTAAKHGVLGLTRAAAKEWGPKGIRVNATGPGHTATLMYDGALERLKEGGVTEIPGVAAVTIQGRDCRGS